jgi:hypothetical protein
MIIRRAFRRFAPVALVIALFALSASSTFADAGDPPVNPEGIIVIGG